MMGEWMGLGFLVVAVVLAALLAGAVYLGVRGGLGSQQRDDDPRHTLERRFAAGEIDEDEYHDRLAALPQHPARSPRSVAQTPATGAYEAAASH